ncbi:hypothetical protein [Aurantibacter sp.]|uniref:hypothetical protein n=1 Tax=Aurantibacter sp. TaxID=2807103 RepID=UPI0035C7978B
MKPKIIKGVKGYKTCIAKYLGLSNLNIVSTTSDFQYSFDDQNHDAQIEIINNIVEEEYRISNFLQLWDFISAKNNDWRNVIKEGIANEKDEDRLDIYTYLKDNYFNKFEKDLYTFSIHYDFDNDFWQTDIFIVDTLNNIKQEVEKNSETKNLTFISNTHIAITEGINEANIIIQNDKYLYLKKFFSRLIYFYKIVYDYLYTDYSGYILKLKLSYSKKYGVNHSLKDRFNFDKSLTTTVGKLGFKLNSGYGSRSSLNNVLEHLIDGGFIEKTSFNIFKNAFNPVSNKEIETPIEWKGNIDELYYFISTLTKKKKIINDTGKNYNKHMIYCKTVFRKDGKAMNNITGNHDRPDKKQEIDTIINLFKKEKTAVLG